MQNPIQGQVKYKTMLCKHFETPKGCVYKDKCQFAHGAFELNSSVNTMQGGQQNNYQRQQHNPNMGGGFRPNINKKIPNPANFKIVKCKNFERDGACRYGNTCTFAHGDEEVRSKNENFGNPQFQGGMNPQMMGMFNPYMMDPSMLMGMPGDMSQMGMFPGMMGMDPNAMGSSQGSSQNQSFTPDMQNMQYFQNMFPNSQQPNNNNNQQSD